MKFDLKQVLSIASGALIGFAAFWLWQGCFGAGIDGELAKSAGAALLGIALNTWTPPTK